MTSNTTDLTPPIGSEEQNLQLASELASANLLFAQHELGRRILDPVITTKGLLEIAEHSYKVSGMAKKQEPMDQQGKFVFNINFGGGNSVSIEKLNTTELIDVTPTPYTLAREAAAINFDEAPEFR